MAAKRKTARSWAEGDLLSDQNRRLTRSQLWSETADKLARELHPDPFAVFAVRWISLAALFEPLTDKDVNLSVKNRERQLAGFVRKVCGSAASVNIVDAALKENKNEILNLAEGGQKEKLSKKMSDRQTEAAATQTLKIVRGFRNRVFHGRITPTDPRDRQTASASARILKELTAAFVEAVKA